MARNKYIYFNGEIYSEYIKVDNGNQEEVYVPLDKIEISNANGVDPKGKIVIPSWQDWEKWLLEKFGDTQFSKDIATDFKGFVENDKTLQDLLRGKDLVLGDLTPDRIIQGVTATLVDGATTGMNGTDGKDGVTISKVEIDSNGHLIVTVKDSSGIENPLDAGLAKGDKGQDATSIDSVKVEDIPVSSAKPAGKKYTISYTAPTGVTAPADSVVEIFNGEKGQDGSDGTNAPVINAITTTAGANPGEQVYVFEFDTLLPNGTNKITTQIKVPKDGQDGQSILLKGVQADIATLQANITADSTNINHAYVLTDTGKLAVSDGTQWVQMNGISITDTFADGAKVNTQPKAVTQAEFDEINKIKDKLDKNLGSASGDKMLITDATGEILVEELPQKNVDLDTKDDTATTPRNVVVSDKYLTSLDKTGARKVAQEEWDLVDLKLLNDKIAAITKFVEIANKATETDISGKVSNKWVDALEMVKYVEEQFKNYIPPKQPNDPATASAISSLQGTLNALTTQVNTINAALISQGSSISNIQSGTGTGTGGGTPTADFVALKQQVAGLEVKVNNLQQPGALVGYYPSTSVIPTNIQSTYTQGTFAWIGDEVNGYEQYMYDPATKDLAATGTIIASSVNLAPYALNTDVDTKLQDYVSKLNPGEENKNVAVDANGAISFETKLGDNVISASTTTEADTTLGVSKQIGDVAFIPNQVTQKLEGYQWKYKDETDITQGAEWKLTLDLDMKQFQQAPVTTSTTSNGLSPQDIKTGTAGDHIRQIINVFNSPMEYIINQEGAGEPRLHSVYTTNKNLRSTVSTSEVAGRVYFADDDSVFYTETNGATINKLGDFVSYRASENTGIITSLNVIKGTASIPVDDLIVGTANGYLFRNTGVSWNPTNNLIYKAPNLPAGSLFSNVAVDDVNETIYFLQTTPNAILHVGKKQSGGNYTFTTISIAGGTIKGNKVLFGKHAVTASTDPSIYITGQNGGLLESTGANFESSFTQVYTSPSGLQLTNIVQTSDNILVISEKRNSGGNKQIFSYVDGTKTNLLQVGTDIADMATWYNPDVGHSEVLVMAQNGIILYSSNKDGKIGAPHKIGDTRATGEIAGFSSNGATLIGSAKSFWIATNTLTKHEAYKIISVSLEEQLILILKNGGAVNIFNDNLGTHDGTERIVRYWM